MDCQYLCLRFVQTLLTFIATLADMPRAGSGSVSGCEEPCLANSFRSHISWHPYHLNPVTFWKLYLGMMALPVFRVYLEIISSPNDHLAVRESINVPIFLAFFSVFSILHALMACISVLADLGVEPQTETVHLLSSPICTTWCHSWCLSWTCPYTRPGLLYYLS